MVAQVGLVFLLVASTASAGFLDDLGLKWPPNLPNLMDLAPVPSFPDLSALMPALFAPVSGLTLEVLENNNQSARLNCSWVGAGQETANLTLLVDGEEQKGEGVTKEESSNGIVLTLDWSARNLTFGQGVVVSCTGQAGKEGWASVSSVSELVPVGGQQLPEGKEPLESPDVSSMSQMISVGGGLSEQAEGKKPVESPEQLVLPEGKQQP